MRPTFSADLEADLGELMRSQGDVVGIGLAIVLGAVAIMAIRFWRGREVGSHPDDWDEWDDDELDPGDDVSPEVGSLS